MIYDVEWFWLTCKERDNEPVEHVIDYIRRINWGSSLPLNERVTE